MAKMTIRELKRQISDIISEAKKAEEKESKSSMSRRPQVEAFGFYDAEHDFSSPLGAANLYRQQGAVNWGPYTVDNSADPRGLAGAGSHNPNGGGVAAQFNMREGDERAIRALVREVIQNGLIDESSAWSPFLKKSEPLFENSWEEIAYRLVEKHWYDRKDTADKPEGKAKGFEKEKDRASVKKHGMSKK